MTSENVSEHEAVESAAAVSAKAVDDQLIDELVNRAQAEGLQLTGEGGLLQQLTKRLLESALEGEITDHLGYDKHDPAGKDGGNSRNGKRSKSVLTDVGPVEIAVPRDRDGSFEPKIVKKRQKRLTGVDEMVISLAAKGLTTGEVQAHLAEVYGAEISRQTISTITDKVLEGMAEWQSRPLDAVYPVVFIDAIHVKIRDGAVANRPVYVALAVTTEGRREILGLWAGDGGEGAKHWLHILTEIKNRGVNDVLMLVCDGLKGLPDAVETVWPKTIVQTCVVHLLRNSFRYAARQDWDKIAKLLKPVYTAPTEEAALDRFAEFADVWGGKYPAIVKLWENAWEEFTPFLRFDTEIRRIVCTTNAIESVNARIRRAVKARQDKERADWGDAWQDTGKVFTKEDGSCLHPETASETFRRILATTDLPPITLRDLRHVAATLTHGGGGDIHAVKETLRHSTITLTSDTYTSLLPELDREIAEKAARLVPRSRSAAE